MKCTPGNNNKVNPQANVGKGELHLKLQRQLAVQAGLLAGPVLLLCWRGGVRTADPAQLPGGGSTGSLALGQGLDDNPDRAGQHRLTAQLCRGSDRCAHMHTSAAGLVLACKGLRSQCLCSSEDLRLAGHAEDCDSTWRDASAWAASSDR